MDDSPVIESGVWRQSAPSPGLYRAAGSGSRAAWRSPRRSRSGMNERTGGTRSKLYGGGGELVAHSSVLPSHGSSPAPSPLPQLTTRLIRKTRTDSATRNDATVMNAFVAPQPSSPNPPGYV